MEPMILLTLVTATAVLSSLLTAHLAGIRHAPDAAGHFAAVWREGYLAGVADERTSAALDVPGYGPNRCNPYPGPEQLVQHA